MCYWDCVDYVRMELRELKINDDNIKTKIWTSIIVLQLYIIYSSPISSAVIGDGRSPPGLSGKSCL